MKLRKQYIPNLQETISGQYIWTTHGNMNIAWFVLEEMRFNTVPELSRIFTDERTIHFLALAHIPPTTV